MHADAGSRRGRRRFHPGRWTRRVGIEVINEGGRDDRTLECPPSLAGDCGLGCVRLARTRGSGGHRHEVALERLRRRVGTRLQPDERPRRLAAFRRVRLRAQRNAARERLGVPVRRDGRRGANASRLRRRDGAPHLGRSPLGDRDPNPRNGSAVDPVRSRLRARSRAGPPAGDDRRGWSVHGKRRSRPRREPRPAPGRAAFHTGHALCASLRVRVGRRGARAGGAGSHGGRCRLRSARADQPVLSARRRRQSGRAPDRDGRGRGLRTLLRRALTRGAKPRPRVARGTGTHRAHFGADGARLRDDRDGCGRRAVRDPVECLQRDCERNDRRRRLCGRGLGDGPAGDPRAAGPAA